MPFFVAKYFRFCYVDPVPTKAIRLCKFYVTQSNCSLLLKIQRSAEDLPGENLAVYIIPGNHFHTSPTGTSIKKMNLIQTDFVLNLVNLKNFQEAHRVQEWQYHSLQVQMLPEWTELRHLKPCGNL